MIAATRLADFKRVRAQLLLQLYTKGSDHKDTRGLVSLVSAYTAAIASEIASAIVVTVSA